MTTTPQDTGNFNNVEVMRFGNNIRAWTSSTDGRIFKLYDVAPPIGIRQISNQLPGDFRLCPNYPNPFNPITKIQFDVPKEGFVKLAIYDMNGKVVSIILNRNLKAGKYEAEWDAAAFSSGVYICSMKAGAFTGNQKMVLLK
jgi:hypothetical protein